MLLRGEALIQSFTIGFSVSGERGNWRVTTNAPGGVVSECETQEATWFLLFNDMLADAYETASHNKIPAPAGVA